MTCSDYMGIMIIMSNGIVMEYTVSLGKHVDITTKRWDINQKRHTDFPVHSFFGMYNAYGLVTVITWWLKQQQQQQQ